MKDKRQALVNELTKRLQAIHSDYRISQRFRKAQMRSIGRPERVEVMGDNATYCEVDFEPSTATEPRANSTWQNRHFRFTVRVWFGYYDADSYGSSSQKVWDEIVGESTGILRGIEEQSLIEDDNGKKYALYNPINVNQRILKLDGQGQELAHFLEYQIDVGN